MRLPPTTMNSMIAVTLITVSQYSTEAKLRTGRELSQISVPEKPIADSHTGTSGNQKRI